MSEGLEMPVNLYKAWLENFAALKIIAQPAKEPTLTAATAV